MESVRGIAGGSMRDLGQREPAGAEQKERQVVTELNALGAASEVLEKTVASLRGRLEPVLTVVPPTSPERSASKEAEVPRSRLAEVIRCEAKKVSSITSQLEDLIDRCQL